MHRFVTTRHHSNATSSGLLEEAEAALYDELRSSYLVLAAMATPDSVPAYIDRLQWALATPHNISLYVTNLKLASAPAVGERGYEPVSLSRMAPAERERLQGLLLRHSFADVALYRAAVRVEEEQRRCFEQTRR